MEKHEENKEKFRKMAKKMKVPGVLRPQGNGQP